ncbi:14828_t:CDS:2, partial [Racocetra persica]
LGFTNIDIVPILGLEVDCLASWYWVYAGQWLEDMQAHEKPKRKCGANQQWQQVSGLKYRTEVLVG